MRRVAAIVIACLLPVAAWAVGTDDLRPGETKRSEAVRSLGEPGHAWSTRLLSGQIEPFLKVQTPANLMALYNEARRKDRSVVKVEVLEWQGVQAVFLDETLWYTVTPIADADEARTVEALNRLVAGCSDPATKTTVCDADWVRYEHRAADIVSSRYILVNKADGTAAIFLWGKEKAKVRFQPGTNPGLGGFAVVVSPP